MVEPRFWGKNSQTRAEVLLRIMGWTLNLGPEYLSSVVTIYQGGNCSMERGRRVCEEALPPQDTHLQTKCLWSTTRATPQRAGDHCHSPWLSQGPASHQHHPPCYTQGSICANWAWATFSKAPGEGVTPSEFGDMTLEMVKSGVKS